MWRSHSKLHKKEGGQDTEIDTRAFQGSDVTSISSDR